MNPLIRFLVDLFGLTEEQIAKLKAEQPIEVTAGQLFMNNDPTLIRVGTRNLCCMCLNLPRPVMHALMPALTDVYRMMDKMTTKRTQAATGELEHAVGEGMGTARPNPQTPNTPPRTHPWTPDDKIPN